MILPHRLITTDEGARGNVKLPGMLLMIPALGFFIKGIALMFILVPILAPVGAHLFLTASIAKDSPGEVSRYQRPFAAVHVVVRSTATP